MSKNIKELSLSLCGSDHCPSLTVGEKEVIFKDDLGGKVTLTLEEFDILKDNIKNNRL